MQIYMYAEQGRVSIAVGPWGGPNGDVWSYKPSAPIKEVTIVHGSTIDSITFKCHNTQHSEECYITFADDGDNGYVSTEKGLNNPMEYLTNISGTFEDFSGYRGVVIKSLCFYTNLTKYGPFGSNNFGTVFSSAVESGVVVGFFGRTSGNYVSALGIYVALKSSISSVVPKQDNSKVKKISGVNVMMGETVPREVGPWGGSGGKAWDDGVFSFVKEIRLDTGLVYFTNFERTRVFWGIQFLYVNRDGINVLSPVHGMGRDRINVLLPVNGMGRSETHEIIKMDEEGEFLVGVSGYYAPLGSGINMEAIVSITFYTNKGKYGPYGWGYGSYFSSVSSDGKVVGFHGRSGSYLNAIGVHTEYF